MSGAALFTTVGWNLQNRWHTDRVARRIRGEAFAFDEWKSQRTEVLRVLRQVEEKFGELDLLGRSANKPPELKKRIAEIGQDVTRLHLSLQRELERVDADWVACAYGADYQGESDWDCIHSSLVDIALTTNQQQIIGHIETIVRHSRGVSAAVNLQVRIRTAEHDPVKY